MKADRKKLELAMARACVLPEELARLATIPRPSLNNVISGKGVMPATLGKVARALGCDPLDIIQDEIRPTTN